MDRPVLRSERYKSIVIVSIVFSLLGIAIFLDMPKMFTKGYLVIDYWEIGEVLKPLIGVIALLFILTTYLSIKSRPFKESLTKLRPKYHSILKGTFRKDLPGLNDLRWEIIEKIQRCIKPRTRFLLYDDLYAVCLLLGVVRSEREEEVSVELIRWLEEKGYPDRKRLEILPGRARGLLKDDIAFFKFLQGVFLEPRKLSGPKWRILSAALGREFHRDDIPSYFAEFQHEEIGREGLVGVFVSFVVFLCLVGGGIIQRIFPINLFGAKKD